MRFHDSPRADRIPHCPHSGPGVRGTCSLEGCVFGRLFQRCGIGSPLLWTGRLVFSSHRGRSRPTFSVIRFRSQNYGEPTGLTARKPTRTFCLKLPCTLRNHRNDPQAPPYSLWTLPLCSQRSDQACGLYQSTIFRRPTESAPTVERSAHNKLVQLVPLYPVTGYVPSHELCNSVPG